MTVVLVPADKSFSYSMPITGLDTDSHPSCCGITQMMNFAIGRHVAALSIEDRIAKIKEAVEQVLDIEFDKNDYDNEDGIEKFSHAIECVLAGKDQMDIWEEPLKAAGFAEVFSFINDKSGNRCHVYYFNTGQ